MIFVYFFFSLHDVVDAISLVLEKYVAVANQKSLDYLMDEMRLMPLIQKVLNHSNNV